MPALSGPDTTRVRSEGHRQKLYLKAIVPATVFAARVNSSTLVKGDVAIPFDTVTLGAYTDIVGGMTLWIGSAAGLSDIGYGRVRIKSATSTTLALAVNVIPWADNVFLTVKQEFLEWPKEVRIEAGIVYVDGNDAYTNLTQASKWGPVVIMGSSGAWLFTDGASVHFDLSPSYPLAAGATIASYSINYGDGATSTSAVTDHNYAAEGYYIATTTVTDSLGNASTSRRAILIVSEGNTFTDFEPGALECQIDGGAKLSFKMHGDCTLADFPRGCQVVMFADEYFGSYHGSIGYEAYRSHVKFFGTLDDGTLALNPQTSEITFTASSIDGMLGRNSPFPVFVQDAAAATHWEQAESLTMRRALYYLLKFHSTLLEVADVFLPADSTPMAFADFAGESVWSQLVGFSRTRRFLRAGVTPQGSLYVRMDPNIVAVADRAGIAQTIQLTDADWINQVSIAERDWPATNFEQLSGVIYDGNPAHAVQPCFAKAPGYPNKTGGALPYGSPDDTPYFQFLNQTEAKAWAGNRLAQLNSDTGDIVIPLDGNWTGVFDPAWQEYVKAPAAGFTTVRGAQLANARLIPRRMSVQYNAAAGTAETTITCEAETSGAAGETGDAPTTPPTPCPPGYHQDADGNCIPDTPPPSDCPPGYHKDPITGECVPDVINPCPLCNTWRSKVYIATATNGVFFTSDFASGGVLNAGQPTWTAINTGLYTTSLRQMMGDPYNPNTVYVVTAGSLNGSIIYRRWNGAGSWVNMIDAQALAVSKGLAPGFCYFASIFSNINKPAGYLATFMATLGVGGASGYETWFFESADYGATWSAGIRLDYGGLNFKSTQPSAASYGPAGAFKGSSIYDAGKVIYMASQTALGTGQSKLIRTLDGGASWLTSAELNPPINFEKGTWFVDPSDQSISFYSQGGLGSNNDIFKFTAHGTVEAVSLSGGGSRAKYALSPVYNPSGPAAVIRGIAGTTLYKSTDGGVSWSVVATLSGVTGTGQLGLSMVQDSSDFLYIFTNASATSNNHVLFVSADEGVTLTGKSGTDRSSGSTTGLPYDAGGIVDILQIWTEP